MEPILRSLAAVLTCTLTLAAAGQQPYHVVDHWKVGGTGGWDYLLADPAAHLLYLTHGPRVEVLDTRTGKSRRRYHRAQRHARRGAGSGR